MTSTIRKVLASVLVLGSMISVLSVGTSASYRASNTTPAATVSFDTAAFVLSNRTSVSSSTCFSAGGPGPRTFTSNDRTCDTFFDLTNQKPGATASVNLTLRNEGDSDAPLLRVLADPGCATADSSGSGYHGSGDLCPRIQLSIQETDSTFAATTCRYDLDNAGTACVLDASRTLEHFTTNHAATPLQLSGGLAAGAARYFRVQIQLPATTTDQSLQGRAATFGFTWQLTH